jgi:hypothetical protein
MPFQSPSNSLHLPLQQSPHHQDNRQQQQSDSGTEFQPPRSHWDAQMGLDHEYTLSAYLKRAAAAGDMPHATQSQQQDAAPPSQLG